MGNNAFARLKGEAIREIAFGALTNTYQQLGADVAFVLKQIDLTNTTDADIYLTNDSTKNIWRIPAGVICKTIDLSTNNMALVPGDQLFVKYVTAPTTGNFWVEALYT